MKAAELMREDFAALRSTWARFKYRYLYWTWRFVLWLGPRIGRRYLWNGGRRTDGDPTVCPECRHVCRVRNCVHAYRDDGAGDVEGVEYCPKCGSEL